MILAAYLMGSIPNGLLLARLKGIDLQKVGSGNIGATNVYRCVGKGWGIAAFVLDAVKGFVPAFVFPRLMEAAPPWLGLACGVAAVAGHNWPVWLKFKGGKGVSTSAGMLLGIAPAAVGIGFVVFASRWLSRDSSRWARSWRPSPCPSPISRLNGTEQPPGSRARWSSWGRWSS